MAKKIVKARTTTKAAASRRAPPRAAARTATRAAKPAVKVSPRSVALAGVAAGVSAVERAQNNAMKVYETIARQADALRSMTTQAAETLASKTGAFVREGQKLQAQAAKTAQAQAAVTAKEVKAFARKSQKALKSNVVKTIDATVANAKEGVTKLEHVFETRVARTLNTFGVPSAQNVRELQSRMADLQKALDQLNRRGVRV
ncbi:MAG: phasin family protein [Burkholderiales bacterium]|nr:phasin family protein [Nitrosomonadaceae bacterium]